MSKRWGFDDIAWDRFDASKVSPRILAVVKTASLVEANSADYVTYLKNVFYDDAEFHAAADQWGLEERQHGEVLGRWAALADPAFSFDDCLTQFQARYSLPLDAEVSVRGSQAGELIARCVVESGTSSFYSAMRDATDEPVLKEICHRIATDEFQHYQLFRIYYKRYERTANLTAIERLRIAVGRVKEAEDDELAYAFYAGNILPADADAPFDSQYYAREYYRRAMGLYQERHIDNATRMILRAARFRSQGWLADMAASFFWSFVRWKVGRLERQAA